jgi:diguanylate cyclase (GGDEF)-like protein/PAS domain S-box-containing protein
MNTRVPQELSAASVLDSMSDGFVALDRGWRFTYVNTRGAEIQGRPAESLVGRNLFEVYPEAAGTPFEQAYRKAMVERVPTHVEAYYPPWDRWFDQHVYPTADGIAVFFVDVTERRRTEQLSAGQSRILEMIATDTPLEQTLDALIRLIETDSPDLRGSILLLDDDGIHLRHGAAPSLPAEFISAIEGKPIGPRAGSCGTAAYRSAPVIVENIESDPLWSDYRQTASAHGLRACWSTPIFDPQHRVLGTFAMYFDRPARPTEHHSRLIETATQTAAIAILKTKGDQERLRAQTTLRNREAMTSSVFKNAAIGITMVDMDQRLMRCNPAFAGMLGYTSKELSGRAFADFSHPEDIEENRRLYRSLAAGEIDHFQIDKRYIRKDGSIVWGRVTVSMVPQEGSTPSFTVGMIEDITERKKNDEDLQRFRAAMDASGDAILLVDRAHMRYVDVNQTFCELVGYSREEMLGMTPMDLFSADRETLERDYDAIIADNDNSASKTEGQYRRKDGTLIPIETRRRALHTKDGWIIVGTARDITERKHAQRRIEYLATHDGLTDLPNRNLIHDRITQAVAHVRRAGRQLALLYVDLDRFKLINDGFGHPFGDAMIKAAGERLAGVVRDGDTVARQTGDEFLILLADLRKSTDVYIVAQKVIDAFGRPFNLQGREVYLTASVGVSIYPQDGEAVDALIGNADVAMYRAKELGRNAYQFFTREMSDETKRRVELETRLRLAVPRNELQLAYQPKVDLATGRMTGCEALLRWTHPELGAVSPARFIPIAEDSGLIVPIGDWVLRTACLQNKAWLDAGLPPIAVSVNVSARQFLQQDVVAWVMKTLGETGLPPERLELELTESLIAQDVEKVIDTVNQLKSAGVKLSIDDFGTGYSSLSYLKRFRVDTLKIDQSFVRHMLTEQDDAAIVQAVISLAHSLKLKVIAEGVETAEHCKLLRQINCDEMQGYYFSKPAPAAEMEAMLKTGKRLS